MIRAALSIRSALLALMIFGQINERCLFADDTPDTTSDAQADGEQKDDPELVTLRDLKIAYSTTMLTSAGPNAKDPTENLKVIAAAAETVEPRQYQFLFWLYERLNARDDQKRITAEWISAEPESMEAVASRVFWLNAAGNAKEASALLDRVVAEAPKETLRERVDSLIVNLMSVGEYTVAAAVLNEQSTVVSEDLWGLAYIVISWKSVDENRRAQYDKAVMSVAALAAKSAVNAPAENLRSDLLSIMLRSYAVAASKTDESQQVMKFFDHLDDTISSRDIKEVHKEALSRSVDGSRLLYLVRSGQQAEASRRVLENLEKTRRSYAKSKEGVEELYHRFAEAFTVVEREKVPQLVALFKDMGADEWSFIGRSDVLDLFPDSDESGIQDYFYWSTVAWGSAHKSQLERWIQYGSLHTADRAIRPFREITNRIEGPTGQLFDEQSSERKQMLNFYRFANALTSHPSIRDPDHPSPLDELKKEYWINRPEVEDPFDGNIVIVACGLCGKRSTPRTTHSLADAKLAIDYQLSTVGLTGSGAKIDQSDELSDLNTQFWADPVMVVTLIDDDGHYNDPGDNWFPQPRENVQRMIDTYPIDHPVIYSYQSKYWDAICDQDEPRILVYDRKGKLRRVISEYERRTDFEPLAKTIEMLLPAE